MISGVLLSDERGKGSGGDRRITGQFDFRESPLRSHTRRCTPHIANHGQFRASAKAVTVDTAAMVLPGTRSFVKRNTVSL